MFGGSAFSMVIGLNRLSFISRKCSTSCLKLYFKFLLYIIDSQTVNFFLPFC